MIILTDSAQQRIQKILESENNPDVNLRVYVKGGGCTGFSYGFAVDEEINEDDTILECGAFKVLIDSTSGEYLNGAELDYKEDLSGSSFSIKNPNATTTCGCGSSFGV